MAELVLLGDHQGDEEPALRCRAPPEGQGEPESARGGGWAAPEDHQRVPRAVIWAAWPDRGRAWPAVLKGGGGTPHHRCGCQQPAPPGFAQRPHPLALPPAEPATAAAPAPTQATAQVRAAPRRPRRSARAGRKGKVPRDFPPRRSRAPRPTPPPLYSAEEGRAPPPVGGRTGATSARGDPLPRSPLAADR